MGVYTADAGLLGDEEVFSKYEIKLRLKVSPNGRRSSRRPNAIIRQTDRQLPASLIWAQPRQRKTKRKDEQKLATMHDTSPLSAAATEDD